MRPPGAESRYRNGGCSGAAGSLPISPANTRRGLPVGNAVQRSAASETKAACQYSAATAWLPACRWPVRPGWQPYGHSKAANNDSENMHCESRTLPGCRCTVPTGPSMRRGNKQTSIQIRPCTRKNICPSRYCFYLTFDTVYFVHWYCILGRFYVFEFFLRLRMPSKIFYNFLTSRFKNHTILLV